MKRRRFLFWISMGVFSLGEKLEVAGFDDLAAAMMSGEIDPTPTHWRAAHNETWQWYERESYVDDRWVLTGITRPINRTTGLFYDKPKGYLDPSLVPAEMRVWGDVEVGIEIDDEPELNAKDGEHLPSATRRARHGRPPSKWLRSLHADELRIWLKTIDVPEAGVEGMTYFEHLTRDHFFDGEKIEDLAEDEQAKLHAAAHHGY